MRCHYASLVLAAFLPAAAKEASGCDSPESKQLDFWVGEWDLTYGDGGKGTNRITKILDGCAILEEFTGAPGVKLDGRSFSTFDVNAREWKQTWVDSEGSYLDFKGAFEDGRMIFRREATRGGNKFLQRMVFADVTPQSLLWTWQRSDDGKEWKTLWEIRYKRVR
jgi:hypothetical protein